MILALLVRRSLRQHLLSTLVTALSLALAGGLLMSVWVVKSQARETFTRQTGAWDAVLGARGSKLQLVLNAIFHLEASPGNVPFADYQAIATNRAVALAVPIAVGDNFMGYRIVGTLTSLFSAAETVPGRKFQVAIGGRVFEDGFREALVGSFTARRLGLKVGDTFRPYHGLNFDPKAQHEDEYVVTGVLEPSNTPADRVIWIPLAGLQNMSGHAAATASDVSAVLVKLKSPIVGQQLEMMYNRQGDRFTFAWPLGTTLAQLFDKLAWFDKVLELVAYLVALVAAGSVLASIYNSMSARRRDMAILRALGARRFTVFASIVLEATSVAVFGMLGAWGLYLLILTAVASVIQTQTGVVLQVWVWNPVLLTAPVGLVLLGALAGVVPAIKAYRNPVAENLLPES
ncbi:MAG: ABC transporter permease [Pedosphaera sp.]|nr:ABC transporter permease [Pedosphaera sp.]